MFEIETLQYRFVYQDEHHQAYFSEYINQCVKSQRAIFDASIIKKQSLLSFPEEFPQDMQPMLNFIEEYAVVFFEEHVLMRAFKSGILS